jgi:hypothetical protein
MTQVVTMALKKSSPGFAVPSDPKQRPRNSAQLLDDSAAI